MCKFFLKNQWGIWMQNQHVSINKVEVVFFDFSTNHLSANIDRYIKLMGFLELWGALLLFIVTNSCATRVVHEQCFYVYVWTVFTRTYEQCSRVHMKTVSTCMYEQCSGPAFYFVQKNLFFLVVIILGNFLMVIILGNF
jgi:hypothetical protein